MAIHKQSFQRFHPERLEAGFIDEGELSQFPVQFSRKPKQHPFCCTRVGAARRRGPIALF